MSRDSAPCPMCHRRDCDAFAPRNIARGLLEIAAKRIREALR